MNRMYSEATPQSDLAFIDGVIDLAEGMRLSPDDTCRLLGVVFSTITMALHSIDRRKRDLDEIADECMASFVRGVRGEDEADES